MRPVTVLDWIAFVLLFIGAMAWGGFFITDTNLLDRGLEPIADVLDITFALIAAAGLYWLARIFGLGPKP